MIRSLSQLKNLSSINQFFQRNYRAAVLNKFGESLVITERKHIDPHENELLVKVSSAALNYSDINIMKGVYYLKPDVPFVPGFEAAGTVAQVGKRVTEFKEGDRVMMLLTNGSGAFGQYMVVNEKDLIFHIPYSMDFDTAASFGVSYGRAYIAMKMMADERRGNTLLVVTSKGTTGFACIDLAQNIFKINIFAASDTEEKIAKLREKGVLSLFNYLDKRMEKEILKSTLGKGVDFIMDTVGGEVLLNSFKWLRTGGHIVSLGFSSGVATSISLLDLHRLQATLSGVWLGGRSKDEVKEVISQLIAFFDEGFLCAQIGKVYPLDEINQCIKDVENDKVFGKAILKLN